MNAIRLNRLLNVGFGCIALFVGVRLALDERTRIIGALLTALAVVYLGFIIRRAAKTRP